MKEVSKIRLSQNEMHALRETEFFQTKKIVTEKIYFLLWRIIEEAKFKRIFDKIQFPHGTDFTSGKISKGENYLGLPYIILDYPRNFKNESLLAIRTMVWWGHFISSTFLAGGNNLNSCRKSLQRNFKLLRENNFYLCINSSPWLHHFGKDNYVKLNELTADELKIISEKLKFIKLARKIPVSHLGNMQKFSLDSFRIFARLLKSKPA